jgi:hypothetical protein
MLAGWFGGNSGRVDEPSVEHDRDFDRDGARCRCKYSHFESDPT